MRLQQVLDVLFAPQCGGCDLPGTGVCLRCLPPGCTVRTRLRTLDVHALGAYEDGLRRAVLALKSGRRDVARAFAHRLHELVVPGEIVVPVPTTGARRRERGFDGCEFIASLLAEQSALEVRAGLVQIAGDHQRGRDRDARLGARGRFAWRGDPLHALPVTLLDDVVTTGATLEDCAATLREAGALVEKAIVVAKA